MPFKVPNLDVLWNHQPLVAEALQSLKDGVDTIGTKLSVNPQGATSAPAPPSAISVVAQGGVSHVTLTDNNPRTRNTHYFVEWDTSPNFKNAQTIHLGPTRQVRVPTFLGVPIYWKAYSQLPDGPSSNHIYHGSPQSPIGVNDGATGTGLAPTTLTLQTNEVNNGSQSLLDLHAGSNITLVDNGSGQVTINSATTVPSGTFFSGGQSVTPLGTATGPCGNNTVNQVCVVRLILPYQITINKISINCINPAGVSATLCTGVYDSTGATKLIEADFNANSATIQTVTVTATLTPGIYWYAFGITAANANFVLNQSLGLTTQNVLNASDTRIGTAANTISGSVLPSSLGVITTQSAGAVQNIVAAIFSTT